MEEPYYSPAWTKEHAEHEFYLRMLFLFDGFGHPCHEPKYWWKTYPPTN
jgi:hypothetical protein